MFNSEPMEVLEVLSNMASGAKVQHGSKSKVLDPLKRSEIGGGHFKVQGVVLVKFRSDDGMYKR